MLVCVPQFLFVRAGFQIRPTGSLYGHSITHFEQQTALKIVALVADVADVALVSIGSDVSHGGSTRSVQAKRQSCRIVKGG